MTEKPSQEQKMKNIDSFDRITKNELLMMKNEVRNWKIDAMRNLSSPQTEMVEKARWIRIFYRNNKLKPVLKEEDISAINELKTMRNYPVYGTGAFLAVQGLLFTALNKKFNLGRWTNVAYMVCNIGMTYGCYFSLWSWYQQVQISELYAISSHYNFTLDDYLKANVQLFTNGLRSGIPPGLLEEDIVKERKKVDDLESSLLEYLEHLKSLVN